MNEQKQTLYMRVLDTIYHRCAALLALALLIFSSCRNEEPEPVSAGTLRVRLAGVAAAVVTRATPSELGKPEADGFRIGITNAGGTQVYDSPYSDAEITLPTGDYTVAASFGDNPVVGIDAPYYRGSVSVTVEEDKVAQAKVACKVANALVSARFGRDDTEKARFSKFYETYSLQVHIGDYSAEIPDYASSRSAYFRAGSSVELVFAGTLRADGRKVSTRLDLSQSTFPSVFNAADHAIVTLTLPDPESATVVDISKVEVEEATMEETIPLSWLPVPQVKPAHSYDGNGNLRGTDITFTDSYPGMTWRAEVTGVDDDVTYRTVEGCGELVSAYSDNTDGWVYMTAGQYKATFYLLNGSESLKTGSRTFAVASPDLKVTASAYTSHSLYAAGDADAANECDAYTVYDPSVKVNIASSLWNNNRYAKSMNATLGGVALSDATVSGGKDGMVFSFKNQEGKTPQFNSYALVGSLTFGKTSVSGSHDVYITGLPASWTPPTKDAWSGYGTVDWEDTYNSKSGVRLGRNTTSQPQYITCGKFAVPAGVKVAATYDVMMHGATVSTVLTLSFGGNSYFSEKSSGGAFNSKDHTYADTAQFTTGASVTEAKANNSYGSGQTCSRIYSLTFKYGK